MIIFIPVRVVSESNSREHWRVAHKRHKEQKMLTKAFLTTKNVPRWLPVEVKMIRNGVRKLDSDNLQSAFKYVRDAIAEYFIPDLAVGRADDDERITWLCDQVKNKLPSITIHLTWSASPHKFVSVPQSSRKLDGDDPH